MIVFAVWIIAALARFMQRRGDLILRGGEREFADNHGGWREQYDGRTLDRGVNLQLLEELNLQRIVLLHDHDG
jgi:hypothetical protein